jgi:A/G-specific adenine glycosylase
MQGHGEIRPGGASGIVGHFVIIIGGVTLSPRDAGVLRRALLAWYRSGRRDLPWRRTRDPYRVWISEIMLQQTTVGAVVPYYRRFLRAFPTARALASARLDDVLAAWSGLGYYRRARHLHRAARIVVARHGGRFPRLLEEALALPGIGRYTAGAILSIAYSLPLPVVDGNVARVLSRLLLVRNGRSAAGRRRLWSAAAALVAGESATPGDLNQALMELGATVCLPRRPACVRCPVARRCAARAAGLETTVPPPPRRRRPVEVRSAVALVSRGGRFLLIRRRDGSLMQGLWELPAAGPGGSADGLRLHLEKPLTTVRHAVTYRRLRIDVHPARLVSEPVRGRYRWVAPKDLHRVPTSSIVRKVLAAIPRDAVPRHAV